MRDPFRGTKAARVRGTIFDIQRYSLHDGPAIRTNVFLKGCSLSCRWCSNPESQRSQPEIAFFERNCFSCGDCVPACPQKAILMEREVLSWDPQLCNRCGACLQVCVSDAFRLIGAETTAGEVVAQVLRDVAFYGEGGGVTLTGGEPALQPEFSAAILYLAKSEGLHTAMETCGNAPWSHFLPMLQSLDLVLFDLKHMEPNDHRQGTGAGNERILANLRRLAGEKLDLIVRIPLIPGFNTGEASLEAIARFVISLRTVEEVHLLPYHRLARAKYQALGREYALENVPPMKRDEAEPKAEIFRRWGLAVAIGG